MEEISQTRSRTSTTDAQNRIACAAPPDQNWAQPSSRRDRAQSFPSGQSGRGLPLRGRPQLRAQGPRRGPHCSRTASGRGARRGDRDAPAAFVFVPQYRSDREATPNRYLLIRFHPKKRRGARLFSERVRRSKRVGARAHDAAGNRDQPYIDRDGAKRLERQPDGVVASSATELSSASNVTASPVFLFGNY